MKTSFAWKPFVRDGVMHIGNDTYITTSIDPKNPHIPPSAYQHDLLVPSVLAKGNNALQVGVGYGALVHALEHMGFNVTGVDISLKHWQPHGSEATLVEQDFFEFESDTQFNFILIDMCAPFRTGDAKYTATVFERAKSLMEKGGVLSFNVGPWPNFTSTILRSALRTFEHVMILPNTATIVCSDTLQKFTEAKIKRIPEWCEHYISVV